MTKNLFLKKHYNNEANFIAMPLNISYRLKKIYLIEKMKNRYLTTNNLISYKKACFLQEKILHDIHKPDFQQKIKQAKNPITKSLAQKIKKQVDINQIILEDVKTITTDIWKTFSPNYYDQEGNIHKKKLNLFSTNA